METMKFNIPYLKKWINTVFNKGQSRNYYDDTIPIDWNTDQFASWFINNAVDGANVANRFTQKVFGIPAGTKLTNLFAQNNGSGFNKDRYWNKFGSTKSALYDVWVALKLKLGGKHNSLDPAMSGMGESVKMVESIVRRYMSEISVNEGAFEPEYSVDMFNLLYEGINKLEIIIFKQKKDGNSEVVDKLQFFRRDILNKVDSLSEYIDHLEGQ